MAHKYKTWMTDHRTLLQLKAISEIKILGTHDSATYGVKLTDMPPCSPDAEDVVMKLLCNPCLRGPVTAITVPWARCQEHSVYEQLCRGVRFLDLRLAMRTELDAKDYKEKILSNPEMAFTKEEIWVCHSVYVAPFSEVVADIEKFFNELPENHCETVVIDVQSVDGFLDRHHQYLLDHLGGIKKWLVLKDTNMCDPLVVLWQDPMQRIYFLHRKASDVPILEADHLRPRGWFVYSKWNESNTPEMLVTKLKALLSLTGPITAALPIQQMCVTQGVLTATGGDIAKGILCCCCGSPGNVEDFAKQVNSHVLEVWENFDPSTSADPNRDHRNVLLLDFFEHGRSPKGLGAMDLIIALNGGTPKTEPFAQ